MRTAIVGYGVMGKTHTGVVKRIPEAEIACIVDVDPAKREKAAEEVGVKTYASLGEALSAESLDMVNVTLPTFLHADAAVQALEAGVNVLCEKPMAMTPEECGRMVKAWKASGKNLMIAHVLRFWPEYVALKRIIDSGEHGKPLAMHCTRLSGPPLWSWTNWLMDEARSGGALIDLHVHDIDWVTCLFGRPKAVYANGVRRADRGGVCQVLAAYEYDGVSATAEGSWALPTSFGFQMGFRVLFENAAVVYSSAQSPTMTIAIEGEKEPKPVELGEKMEEADSGGNISSTDGYFNECRYFVDCLLKGETPSVVTPEQAALNIEVARAEIRSVDTGERVSLD